MTVGGLRARLRQDSILAAVRDGLAAQGWFDLNRSHQPVRIQGRPAEWNEPIAPNLVALDVLNTEIEEFEVGSALTADLMVAHAEVFAESESLGDDLSNDIRDILRGRLGSSSALPIYDFRHATPPVVGYLQVDNVNSLRNVAPSQDSWVRHWYRVRCEFTDTYYTSEVGL